MILMSLCAVPEVYFMVLLIDNFDSFTYMLRDYVLQCGLQCLTCRNNEIDPAEIIRLGGTSILISPGPGRPERAGITRQVIANFAGRLPILGICLGHQAIGQFFGAELLKAEKPMHGKTSRVLLGKHPIFKEIPQQTEVMRYHSLILKNIKPPMEVIAKTETGEVMAIAHQEFKLVGLQFHPESILSPHGFQIINNWFEYVKEGVGFL